MPERSRWKIAPMSYQRQRIFMEVSQTHVWILKQLHKLMHAFSIISCSLLCCINMFSSLLTV
jgi:hypothetical protein